MNRRLECPKNLSHSENESRAGIDFSFHPSYKLPAKLRCGHDDSLYPQPVQCDCQSRKVGEQQRLGGWKYTDTVTRSKEETKVDARFGNSKFSIASFASDIRSFFIFFYRVSLSKCQGVMVYAWSPGFSEVSIYTHIGKQVIIHVYIQACIRTNMYVYSHVCILTYMYAFIHSRICIYIMMFQVQNSLHINISLTNSSHNNYIQTHK